MRRNVAGDITRAPNNVQTWFNKSHRSQMSIVAVAVGNHE